MAFVLQPPLRPHRVDGPVPEVDDLDPLRGVHHGPLRARGSVRVEALHQHEHDAKIWMRLDVDVPPLFHGHPEGFHAWWR